VTAVASTAGEAWAAHLTYLWCISIVPLKEAADLLLLLLLLLLPHQ
jgi:hypothetical protein